MPSATGGSDWTRELGIGWPAPSLWQTGITNRTAFENPLEHDMYGTNIINFVCYTGYADLLRPMLADENESYGRANYQTASTGWAPYRYAPLHVTCLRNTGENAPCVRVILKAGADPAVSYLLGRARLRDIAVQKQFDLILAALDKK